MRHGQRPDIAIAAAAQTTPLLHAAIFCVGMGQRGQIIWQSEGCNFFLNMELIRLYVCRVKLFTFFSTKNVPNWIPK
jgi:hypothetical protein